MSPKAANAPAAGQAQPPLYMLIPELYNGRVDGVAAYCTHPRFNTTVQSVCNSVVRDGMIKEILPKVVYSDDEYCCLYKPPHWVCRVGGANGADDLALHPELAKKLLLTNYIMRAFRLPTSARADLQYGICIRLDDETSGVVVVAKTVVAYKHLRDAINAHETVKENLALAHAWPTAAAGVGVVNACAATT